MEKKIAKDRKKQIFSVWPRAIKLKANELQITSKVVFYQVKLSVIYLPKNVHEQKTHCSWPSGLRDHFIGAIPVRIQQQKEFFC